MKPRFGLNLLLYTAAFTKDKVDIIQKVADFVSVAGKVWRSDAQEPLDWQVVWTDAGQGGSGPFVGGATGVQVGGAKVLIDNLVVTQNEGSRDHVAAP